MSADELRNFIEQAYKTRKPTDMVYKGKKRKDQAKNLEQVFKDAHIDDPTHLSIDQLGVEADHQMFENFASFNENYNIFHLKKVFRNIFLKHNNKNKGKYLAALTYNKKK
eukprot:122841_1